MTVTDTQSPKSLVTIEWDFSELLDQKEFFIFQVAEQVRTIARRGFLPLSVVTSACDHIRKPVSVLNFWTFCFWASYIALELAARGLRLCAPLFDLREAAFHGFFHQLHENKESSSLMQRFYQISAFRTQKAFQDALLQRLNDPKVWQVGELCSILQTLINFPTYSSDKLAKYAVISEIYSYQINAIMRRTFEIGDPTYRADREAFRYVTGSQLDRELIHQISHLLRYGLNSIALQIKGREKEMLNRECLKDYVRYYFYQIDPKTQQTLADRIFDEYDDEFIDSSNLVIERQLKKWRSSYTPANLAFFLTTKVSLKDTNIAQSIKALLSDGTFKGTSFKTVDAVVQFSVKTYPHIFRPMFKLYDEQHGKLLILANLGLVQRHFVQFGTGSNLTEDILKKRIGDCEEERKKYFEGLNTIYKIFLSYRRFPMQKMVTVQLSLSSALIANFLLKECDRFFKLNHSPICIFLWKSTLKKGEFTCTNEDPFLASAVTAAQLSVFTQTKINLGFCRSLDNDRKITHFNTRLETVIHQLEMGRSMGYSECNVAFFVVPENADKEKNWELE